MIQWHKIIPATSQKDTESTIIGTGMIPSTPSPSPSTDLNMAPPPAHYYPSSRLLYQMKNWEYPNLRASMMIHLSSYFPPSIEQATTRSFSDYFHWDKYYVTCSIPQSTSTFLFLLLTVQQENPWHYFLYCIIIYIILLTIVWLYNSYRYDSCQPQW